MVLKTRDFRVSEETELKGLDIKKHGEPAYPTAAYGHGWEKEGDFRLSSKIYFQNIWLISAKFNLTTW